MCDTALGAYDAEQTNRSSSFCGERGARPMRDLCDTALGAYDAEQTNRSSSFFGEGVPDQCAVLGAWPEAHVLVRFPVSGVGS
ncbi:MAG TPA: hypothetical protein VIM51_06365 [Desulfosporosinus sp.]